MAQTWGDEEILALGRTAMDEGGRDTVSYRELRSLVQAQGGRLSTDRARALASALTAERGPAAASSTTAVVENGEALPAPLVSALARVQQAAAQAIAAVHGEEAGRWRLEIGRLQGEHREALQERDEEITSLREDVRAAEEDLEQAQRDLEEVRGEASHLRESLAKSERARGATEERAGAERTALLERLDSESTGRREADTATERLRGELASVTTDRDAARERVADLQARLQAENEARIRAEASAEDARAQASTTRETVLELRSSLAAMESVQGELRTALGALGRTPRSRKAGS